MLTYYAVNTQLFRLRGIIHNFPRFEEKGTKEMELKQTKKPKRRIREALAELLEESAFEKITVTALAERADIDRKTFYLHYGSISDLMAEIQGEILEEALQLVVSYDLLSPDFDMLGLFRQLNHFIQENATFYHQMVMADNYHFLYNELRDSLKKFLYQNYLHRKDTAALSSTKLSLYIEYVTAGVMSIYVEWLKHPTFDPEEVAVVASDLTCGCFQAMRSALFPETNATL